MLCCFLYSRFISAEGIFVISEAFLLISIIRQSMYNNLNIQLKGTINHQGEICIEGIAIKEI